MGAAGAAPGTGGAVSVAGGTVVLVCAKANDVPANKKQRESNFMVCLHT